MMDPPDLYRAQRRKTLGDLIARQSAAIEAARKAPLPLIKAHLETVFGLHQQMAVAVANCLVSDDDRLRALEQKK